MGTKEMSWRVELSSGSLLVLCEGRVFGFWKIKKLV